MNSHLVPLDPQALWRYTDEFYLLAYLLRQSHTNEQTRINNAAEVGPSNNSVCQTDNSNILVFNQGQG
jgi:hypothetical protein